MAHPWAVFLIARERALVWMRDEMKRGPEEIAEAMSMDPMQVTLILSLADEAPAEVERLRAELAEERAKPKAPERGPGWSDHSG